MKIVSQSVSLEWITPNPLLMIEKAGRTCYKSEDKMSPESAKKFYKMIYQRGHESVAEHAVASLRIICDRGVSHEIVRHRLASYSQESTRYCAYNKDKFGGEISVIEPPNMNTGQHAAWRSACEHSERVYLSLISQGTSPQIARSVLPTCLKTELVMTANFREWKHFIKLRTDPAAHPQIREVAFMIQELLAKECPEVFGKDE